MGLLQNRTGTDNRDIGTVDHGHPLTQLKVVVFLE